MSESDKTSVYDVHVEFVTTITDPKYIQNTRTQYAVPASINIEGLNQEANFTFYSYGILIDNTLLDLLHKIDFNPESVLPITYTLYGESKTVLISKLYTWLTCIAYLDDTNKLVMSTSEGEVLFLPFEEYSDPNNFTVAEGEIASFDMIKHDNKHFLASISSLGTIEVASISKDHPYLVKARYRGHPNFGTCVRFSPGFHSLASSGHDKSIRIHSLESITNNNAANPDPINTLLDEKSIFWGHMDTVTGITYTELESIKSVSLDSTFKLWDVETTRCKHTFGMVRPPVCIDSLVNGYSVIGHINGLVTIYDDKSNSIVFEKSIHRRIISDLKWSKHNDNIFASCSNDGCFSVTDLRFPKMPIYTYTNKGVTEYIRCCCWLNNDTLAIGSSEGAITKISLSNLLS